MIHFINKISNILYHDIQFQVKLFNYIEIKINSCCKKMKITIFISVCYIKMVLPVIAANEGNNFQGERN